jgi:hypothetical protein
MYTTIHTAVTSLVSRVGALAAIGAIGLALVVAGPAAAQDNGPTGKPGKCPVEDQNGNVSYVDTGTRVGLFVCGSDGNWHFGWLVNGRVALPQPGLTPVGVASGSASTRQVARG